MTYLGSLDSNIQKTLDFSDSRQIGAAT